MACAKRAACPRCRGTPAEPTQRPRRRAELAASSQGGRRRGEGLCSPCSGRPNVVLGGGDLQIFSTRCPRGQPEGCSGPSPGRAQLRAAPGMLWPWRRVRIARRLRSPPTRVFPSAAARGRSAELLGRNSYVLADLLYFSKNKQNVLTEKKVYIFQVLKRLLRGRKISCVRHFCKCHLQLFVFPLVDISSWAKQDTPLSPL